MLENMNGKIDRCTCTCSGCLFHVTTDNNSLSNVLHLKKIPYHVTHNRVVQCIKKFPNYILHVWYFTFIAWVNIEKIINNTTVNKVVATQATNQYCERHSLSTSSSSIIYTCSSRTQQNKGVNKHFFCGCH